MVSRQNQIVWTKRSEKQLENAYKYICEDSTKNAAKVIEDIVKAAGKAINNPEFYPPDKYKTNNDGTYRAFEKHKFRIAYRFKSNVIRILRVRHSKMEPQPY